MMYVKGILVGAGASVITVIVFMVIAISIGMFFPQVVALRIFPPLTIALDGAGILTSRYGTHSLLACWHSQSPSDGCSADRERRSNDLNKVNNATTAMLLSSMAVHRLVDNAEQNEQSPGMRRFVRIVHASSWASEQVMPRRD